MPDGAGPQLFLNFDPKTNLYVVLDGLDPATAKVVVDNLTFAQVLAKYPFLLPVFPEGMPLPPDWWPAAAQDYDGRQWMTLFKQEPVNEYDASLGTQWTYASGATSIINNVFDAWQKQQAEARKPAVPPDIEQIIADLIIKGDPASLEQAKKLYAQYLAIKGQMTPEEKAAFEQQQAASKQKQEIERDRFALDQAQFAEQKRASGVSEAQIQAELAERQRQFNLNYGLEAQQQEVARKRFELDQAQFAEGRRATGVAEGQVQAELAERQRQFDLQYGIERGRFGIEGDRFLLEQKRFAEDLRAQGVSEARLQAELVERQRQFDLTHGLERGRFGLDVQQRQLDIARNPPTLLSYLSLLAGGPKQFLPQIGFNENLLPEGQGFGIPGQAFGLPGPQGGFGLPWGGGFGGLGQLGQGAQGGFGQLPVGAQGIPATIGQVRPDLDLRTVQAWAKSFGYDVRPSPDGREWYVVGPDRRVAATAYSLGQAVNNLTSRIPATVPPFADFAKEEFGLPPGPGGFPGVPPGAGAPDPLFAAAQAWAQGQGWDIRTNLGGTQYYVVGKDKRIGGTFGSLQEALQGFATRFRAEEAPGAVLPPFAQAQSTLRAQQQGQQPARFEGQLPALQQPRFTGQPGTLQPQPYTGLPGQFSTLPYTGQGGQLPVGAQGQTFNFAQNPAFDFTRAIGRGEQPERPNLQAVFGSASLPSMQTISQLSGPQRQLLTAAQEMRGLPPGVFEEQLQRTTPSYRIPSGAGFTMKPKRSAFA